jgi:hypothetical protein
MSEIDARDFGRLESEVSQLKDLLEEVRSEIKYLRRKQDEMTGGTKVLLTIAAILGAGLSQTLGWIIGKLH